MIEDDGYLPGFVYSIGLYKTYQHPELIIFGLRTDVMNHLLYSLAEEIKKGVKFETGIDCNGIISDYPVRFIEVAKEYYSDYLGYCGWFYNRSFDFPTYQLVWTDREGNYPWDENFEIDIEDLLRMVSRVLRVWHTGSSLHG